MTTDTTTVRKSYTSSFILDKSKLLRINSIIEQSFSDIKVQPHNDYIVTLRDEKKITLKSVDQVLNLDNTIRNPITDLRVVSSDLDEEPKNYIQVTYDSTNYLNINIVVRGENNKWSNQVFSELEEQVERTLNRNIINRYLKDSSFIIFFFIIIFAILAGVFLGNSISNEAVLETLSHQDILDLQEISRNINSRDEKIDFIFEFYKRQLPEANIIDTQSRSISIISFRNVFLSAPILVMVACLIYALVYLYPRAVYVWGDHEQYYTNILSRRKTLWGIIISSIILSILTNLFVVGLSDFL